MQNSVGGKARSTPSFAFGGRLNCAVVHTDINACLLRNALVRWVKHIREAQGIARNEVEPTGFWKNWMIVILAI